MRKIFTIIALTLISLNYSYAQLTVAGEGIYIIPVGGFSGWFDKHYSGTIYLGQVRGKNSFLFGGIEFYKFYKENEDKLYYKDLNLELKIYGVSAEYRHSLIDFYFVNLYGVLGTGLYRWFGLRGEYSIRDSVGNVIDYVAERRYQDWSAGFGGGVGVEFKIVKNLSLNLNARYKIIVGEMWQTLVLRLEQASGFQWLGIQAGLQVKF
jgi:opacity protein-like surface antigen